MKKEYISFKSILILIVFRQIPGILKKKYELNHLKTG